MASRTITTSGNTTTVVVTDEAGNTATLTLTNNPGSGSTMTFASSGNVQQDGTQMVAQLLLQMSTGLVPTS